MRPLLMLLLLSLIIAVHESGHFVAMRLGGVTVEEFSIGLGPTLYERRGEVTVFRIRLLPFGGYVSPADKGPGSLGAASRPVRCIIFLAGMVMNALTAFLVLLLVPAAWKGQRSRGLRRLVSALVGSFGYWLSFPFLFLYLLVTRGTSLFRGLTGPIGIIMGRADGTGQTGETGQKEDEEAPRKVAVPLPVWLAHNFALLSAAIAGFNLLPIYPLDGGQVVSALLEGFGPSVIALYEAAGLLIFASLVLIVFLIDFTWLSRRNRP
ncbi:hypothetical protein AMJ57_04600 [Parcubacteria bacterium SG8_24]|nr:MAG: hypothetical protein AMJ57_04600 [Parcubacteria bacterium SG8_24]